MAKNRAYNGTVYATEELLKCERFVGPVYNPGRRDNGIIEALLKNGKSSFCTSADFLVYDCHYPNVISEPYPAIAVAWVHRAMHVTDDKVAFLLPLRFMETMEFKELIDKTPFARIYVLTKHLPIRKGCSAWFVWQKGHVEQPAIRWI